uniref:Ig-like domain-containing protein n=1 Tax=Hucho hucho TaxID=62062 RepID=A0A4W5RX45_9TELE
VQWKASGTAPTVFPLMQCGSGAGDMLTLGCIATGFTPASLTFKWKDTAERALNDFVQYPVVQTGGKYIGVSQLRVKRAEWDNKKTFKCAVEHSAGSKEVIMQKPVERPPISFYVMTPSKEEMQDNQTASFACLARDFSPKHHEITWLKNNKPIAKGVKNFCQDEKKGEDNTMYSATSFLSVGETEWTDGSEYTCQFSHKSGNQTKTVKYSSGEMEKRPSVFLLAPTEITSSDMVTLTCYVKDFYPKTVLVAWLVNDELVTVNSTKYQYNTTSAIETGRTFYSVYGQLTMGMGDWIVAGEVYSCVVYHETIPKSTKMLVRTLDRTSNKPNLVNLSLNVPQSCKCLVLTDCPCSNTMETDRDSMRKTAFTFIILFLITLLYGVGATAIKVLPCWECGVLTRWDTAFVRFDFS